VTADTDARNSATTGPATVVEVVDGATSVVETVADVTVVAVLDGTGGAVV